LIVDCFLFDDEFDILDCRLYQLRGIVDLFVAIEGDLTHMGEPKPYRLTENLSRYPDVPMEVIRAELGDIATTRIFQSGWLRPDTIDAWKRDAKQRDYANELLFDLPKDAVVIYGDVDEIPRREVVTSFDNHPMAIGAEHLIYATTLYHPDPWYGSVIGKRSHLGGPASARLRRTTLPRIEHAGWHLSWFGTPEDRIRKLYHFSHHELVETVGDKVGSEYPAAHRHVDGSDLYPWTGDVPQWVADGFAPLHWTQTW
jgi:beta-1,4-mannosyl-glycoprotein beta-1,4-N-acetylglucosaminyltransferase